MFAIIILAWGIVCHTVTRVIQRFKDPEFRVTNRYCEVRYFRIKSRMYTAWVIICHSQMIIKLKKKKPTKIYRLKVSSILSILVKRFYLRIKRKTQSAFTYFLTIKLMGVPNFLYGAVHIYIHSCSKVLGPNITFTCTYIFIILFLLNIENSGLYDKEFVHRWYTNNCKIVKLYNLILNTPNTEY